MDNEVDFYGDLSGAGASNNTDGTVMAGASLCAYIFYIGLRDFNGMIELIN